MLERIHPEVPDGWYETGDPSSKAIGFDNDMFYGHFTRDKNRIIIHYIYSREHGSGNVQRFFAHLINEKWEIIVVQPNDTMVHICDKFGFSKCSESIDGYYRNAPVECWRRV